MAHVKNTFGAECCGVYRTFCLRLNELDLLQGCLSEPDLSKIYNRILTSRNSATDLLQVSRAVLRFGLMGGDGLSKIDATKAVADIVRNTPVLLLHDLVISVYAAALTGPPMEDTAPGKIRATVSYLGSRMRALWRRASELLGLKPSQNGPTTSS